MRSARRIIRTRGSIQTLPKTIGLPAVKVPLFDAFRRARNVADYEGDPVELRLVEECIEAAQALLVDVRAWIKKNQPDPGGKRRA